MDMRAYRLVFHLMSAMTAGIMAGCVSTADRTPLTYQMIDHPDENRIELRYRNDGEQTKCLTASMWPDADGKVYQTGNRTALVVEGRRFPIAEFYKGPCYVVELTCVARVAPGQEITSSIPYQQFGLPESLRFKRKILHLSPLVPGCHG